MKYRIFENLISKIVLHQISPNKIEVNTKMTEFLIGINLIVKTEVLFCSFSEKVDVGTRPQTSIRISYLPLSHSQNFFSKSRALQAQHIYIIHLSFYSTFCLILPVSSVQQWAHIHSSHSQDTVHSIQRQRKAAYGMQEMRTAAVSLSPFAENGFPEDQ